MLLTYVQSVHLWANIVNIYSQQSLKILLMLDKESNLVLLMSKKGVGVIHKKLTPILIYFDLCAEQIFTCCFVV